MPDIEHETFTVKGLGIMGSAEFPACCQVKPMKMGVEFTDANEAQYRLAEIRQHTLDLRVIKQGHESSSGELSITDHQYIILCQPIKTSGGDIAPVSPQGVSGEFAVIGFKEFRARKLCRHIDVVKMIYEDGSGVDRFAEIRRKHSLKNRRNWGGSLRGGGSAVGILAAGDF